MCITSKNASLTKTKILSFKKDDGSVFLSYSNEVINLDNGKNCMILPIPGKVLEERFYDTANYNSFMNYIGDRTVISEFLTFGIKSKGITRGLKSLSAIEVGMYNVHIVALQEEFDELNEKYNLGISQSLISFFLKHYKGFQFVCCLFDSNKKMDAQPIAFDYIPTNPNVLFYPSMDSHDGSVPVDREFVAVDHFIIAPVKYKTIDLTHLHVPDFLNNKEWGTYRLDGEYKNGDFYFDLTQDLTQPDLKRSYER